MVACDANTIYIALLFRTCGIHLHRSLETKGLIKRDSHQKTKESSERKTPSHSIRFGTAHSLYSIPEAEKIPARIPETGTPKGNQRYNMRFVPVSAFFSIPVFFPPLFSFIFRRIFLYLPLLPLDFLPFTKRRSILSGCSAPGSHCIQYAAYIYIFPSCRSARSAFMHVSPSALPVTMPLYCFSKMTAHIPFVQSSCLRSIPESHPSCDFAAEPFSPPSRSKSSRRRSRAATASIAVTVAPAIAAATTTATTTILGPYFAAEDHFRPPSKEKSVLAKLAGTRDNAKRFLRMGAAVNTHSMETLRMPRTSRPRPMSEIIVSPQLAEMLSNAGSGTGRPRTGSTSTISPVQSSVLESPTASSAASTAPFPVIRNEKIVATGSGISVGIALTEPVLFLAGYDPNDPSTKKSAILRGQLHLKITKCVKIKKISICFRGHAQTDWPDGNSHVQFFL